MRKMIITLLPLANKKSFCIGVFSLLFLSFSGSLLADTPVQISKPLLVGLDSDAAKATLRFREALRSGDAETARSLLASDVQIYEGKGAERSAEEYASHHMLGDMAFLKAMKITTIEHQVSIVGDVAYSLSRSKMQGQYKTKEIDSFSVETMVLVRQALGWKIVHIHWSNN